MERVKLTVKLKIEIGEDILRCSQIAMLLEASGHPKPGNVHRTMNFPNTRYEHFLIGPIACGHALRELITTSGKIGKGQLGINELNLGNSILECIKETQRWQNGGNINLGMLLLLNPISAAAAILLEREKIRIDKLKDMISKVVRNTTPEDAVKLYKAIEICQPGGLGEVKDFDVTKKTSTSKILRENVNLYKIFEISSAWDNISAEWVSGFKITFEIGVPFFQKTYEDTLDVNVATVDTYLHVLANVSDTLIKRKSGDEKARLISKKAKQIMDGGGMRKMEQEIKHFDDYLQMESGKLNPGTTADLTAAIIMVNLLDGLKV